MHRNTPVERIFHIHKKWLVFVASTFCENSFERRKKNNNSQSQNIWHRVALLSHKHWAISHFKTKTVEKLLYWSSFFSVWIMFGLYQPLTQSGCLELLLTWWSSIFGFQIIGMHAFSDLRSQTPFCKTNWKWFWLINIKILWLSINLRDWSFGNQVLMYGIVLLSSELEWKRSILILIQYF